MPTLRIIGPVTAPGDELMAQHWGLLDHTTPRSDTVYLCWFYFSTRTVTLSATCHPDNAHRANLGAYTSQLVRRPTGGFPLLHEPRDLGYAVIAPHRFFGTTEVATATKAICSQITKGLHDSGIPAKLYPQSSTDIVVGTPKISGSAYQSSHGAYLVHGSIFDTVHADAQQALLGIPEHTARTEMTGISTYRISHDSIRSRIEDCLHHFFTNTLDNTIEVSRADYTPKESAAIEHVKKLWYGLQSMYLEHGLGKDLLRKHHQRCATSKGPIRLRD